MAMAATTVKKPSKNSPIKRARPWRCERKQTPRNHVRAMRGRSWEKTLEDASLLVEQRVGQNATDNATLVPLVETVERRCRERPQKVSADSGFFCLETIVELAQRGLDVYVPDSNLARELNRGQRAPGAPAVRHPEHRRMRRKLRDPAGRAVYQRRKAIVEPVIGVLKQQRGMRQFRRRVPGGVRFIAVVTCRAAGVAAHRRGRGAGRRSLFRGRSVGAAVTDARSPDIEPV